MSDLTSDPKKNALLDRQADAFARGLLMPGDEFVSAYWRYGGIDVDLADYFQVSVPWVRTRIEELRDRIQTHARLELLLGDE